MSAGLSFRRLGTAALAWTLYPLLRRVEFPGKRRLCRLLPAPTSGTATVSIYGGALLALDLGEMLQRDTFVGLFDCVELDIVKRCLSAGGDFVDVGAHVGIYGVTACRALRAGRRALLLEPNPVARAQLERNLELNGVTVATVLPAAASDGPGTAVLHVPTSPDASWSSLQGGRFAEGVPVEIETTTVDREVERLGLVPSLIKIDVEGHELAVLAGAAGTCERHRPAVIRELGQDTALAVAERAEALGYTVYSARHRHATLGVGTPGGIFNVVLVPTGRERAVLGRRAGRPLA